MNNVAALMRFAPPCKAFRLYFALLSYGEHCGDRVAIKPQ
jgi:hypothetical protein